MNEIENNEYCFKLHDIRCGCPTSADDMVLISHVKHGLDNLLDICYTNSQNERILYNPDKCKVVVFNDKSNVPRKWKFGSREIEEAPGGALK
jgi:hypothetical protein